MIQHLKKKIEIYFDKSVIKNWSEPWKKSSLPLKITKKIALSLSKNEKKIHQFFQIKIYNWGKIGFVNIFKKPAKNMQKIYEKNTSKFICI